MAGDLSLHALGAKLASVPEPLRGIGANPQFILLALGGRISS
jgi:hypothetical protein